MAKGIDGYSHTVALHNDNYTIAVVGTGVDICYPIEHLTLMNEIIKKEQLFRNLSQVQVILKVILLKEMSLWQC